MERSGRYPLIWLALAAPVLAFFAAAWLTSGTRGPTCAEQSGAARPGFVALATLANPACVRIHLR